MARLIVDLSAYLRAVFVESGRWVLALFDILGLVLFFCPQLAESLLPDASHARGVGAGILFLSFLLANFSLYRRLTREAASLELGEYSLRLYPHRTVTSVAVKMEYVGEERADQLELNVSYIDERGHKRRRRVCQFFPEGDPKMQSRAGLIDSLEPGQVAYFYLPGGMGGSGGKVTVVASFVGARSCRHVRLEREFPVS